jgi:hypothetical protein
MRESEFRRPRTSPIDKTDHMDRTRIGQLLLGLGVVLVVAGVIVWMDGDDDTAVSAGDGPVVSSSTTMSTTTTVPSTTASAATSTTASTTTSTTTSTSTTSTTAAPIATESVEDFFAVLRGALDGGDAAVLVDRMNAATIERYGVDQCEAYATSVAGNGFDATLLSTSEVDSWDYTTDEVTTTLTGVVAADIERTISGQTVPQTTHWQLVDGRYTWFTDCGSPL